MVQELLSLSGFFYGSSVVARIFLLEQLLRVAPNHENQTTMLLYV